MASEFFTTEMVVAVTGTLGAIGAGLKYVWDRIAARVRDSEIRFEAERVRHELKVENERLRYEAVIQDQIREMRREISLQEREITYLRRISYEYSRHINALEQLMRKAGMEIPLLALPDYPAAESENG